MWNSDVLKDDSGIDAFCITPIRPNEVPENENCGLKAWTPHEEKDKGNPAMKHESTKRIPSQGESAAIALSGKKQARCGFCQGMGHNRRTCPMRRQQEEEAKAMEE